MITNGERPLSRDHPRVCGNHCFLTRERLRNQGSPPRVREPRSTSSHSAAANRITPACAGTTMADSTTSSRTADHPRVCGNHPGFFRALFYRLGSPPRVREPHDRGSRRIWHTGITPACAGTTSSCRTSSTAWQDHPRVCGNHVHSVPLYRYNLGSPPRVREPPSLSMSSSYSRGITPACAGTTLRG